ncbi:DNA-binding CsgD family transcriptional regulator [Nonomuraea thailandensis]|uniref:DNA-binding CsgD family transcriptional regulator n=1 Tax=Nonomuraea thailandensis TaxID=1188745 RepID=A0A9X2JZD0_9ACTN|nr:hypothetical protein [Nonomuraea thailandensis]MCP2353620.1 DNA-binding CsgD family transcriptional regulator [Nonomuraea thailandensis]
MDLPELAAHLRRPEAEIREALDRLAELHLVSETGSVSFRVIGPQIGLLSLLSRGEADLARHQRQIEATRAAVAELVELHDAQPGLDAEVIERLNGVSAVRARLAELAQMTRGECLSILPGKAMSAEAIEAGRLLDESALRRGVAFRTIYQDSIRNDRASMHHVQRLASLGASARTLPTLPLMMIVVDRETALIPIEPAASHLGALVLRSRGAVAAICVLFEHLWAAAAPLEEPVATDDAGLSTLEHELVRLLATGHTDEQASRKLGVSLRTTRRMTARLMVTLKARSRFEAGVLAARRGWT